VPVGVGSFGISLRRLRERAGLTQEQLAEAARLSPRAIRSLERGERRQPYQHTVEALAKALGLTTAERLELLSAVPTRAERHELPNAPTRIIGREEDVQAIVDGFLAGRTRLITLTGPGGVGKTRLALAAARVLAPGLADGVAFVSLAELREPALVLPTIAQALGLREGGTLPIREVLHDYVRHRRMLIVLDNLEHVLTSGSSLADLLATAPQLAVLATSRSPLRIRGELLQPVLPLGPAAATELFTERTEQAAAHTCATDVSVVTEICRRLDGLPLAIELAAARMRVLPAAALLARLDHVLGDRGARDLPERQQTLRDTLDWSHDLLDDAGQAMFRRLAIFSGSWTLVAIQLG
jgi:predicted ATPase/DNA-binding XRE family transcriptional regulator